jgi:hypothetical protein
LSRVQEYPATHGIRSAYNNENDNKHGDYNSYLIHQADRPSKVLEYNAQFDDISSRNEGQDGCFNNDNGRVEVGRDGQFLRNAKRTILLTNLPEAATHADVTEAIKGGMLLDIFLRSQDRAASVSFLDENDANNFFRYAKRNDLYIRGKRVSTKTLLYFTNIRVLTE